MIAKIILVFFIALCLFIGYKFIDLMDMDSYYKRLQIARAIVAAIFVGLGGVFLAILISYGW